MWAGQTLGSHIGGQTMSDVAVSEDTPDGVRLRSWFDVITPELFQTCRDRGVRSRAELIISASERDADLLVCADDGEFTDPGTIPDWLRLE